MIQLPCYQLMHVTKQISEFNQAVHTLNVLQENIFPFFLPKHIAFRIWLIYVFMLHLIQVENQRKKSKTEAGNM